jgi:uncharacterized NAD-dependent epimerase/dehydratase family protein
MQKTAHGLIRGTERFDIDIIAVINPAHAGKDAGEDGKMENLEERVINFQLQINRPG